MIYRVKNNRRSVLSLVVAILSVAAIIYYQLFWSDYSSYTFDPTADAIYRLLALPMACFSIPFFLSSRFIAIRLSTVVLRVFKAICLSLGIAYLLCIAILMLAVEPISYGIRNAALRYIGIFVPYIAIAIGLILGANSRDE